MTEADPLVRPLAEIVVELAWLLEATIDDDGEPRGAAKTLDWIAFMLTGLADEHRLRLADIVAGIAAARAAGPQREFLESFAFAFGLTSDDGEQ